MRSVRLRVRLSLDTRIMAGLRSMPSVVHVLLCCFFFSRNSVGERGTSQVKGNESHKSSFNVLQEQFGSRL